MNFTSFFFFQGLKINIIMKLQKFVQAIKIQIVIYAIILLIVPHVSLLICFEMKVNAVNIFYNLIIKF